MAASWPHTSRVVVLASLLLLCGLHGQAQAIPDRRISLIIASETVADALNLIAEAGDFRFSYNPSQLPLDSVVSLQVHNRPVREVLSALLGDAFEWKATGKHLILQRTVPNHVDDGPTNYTISGFIVDARTGQTVPQATVFDVSRKSTALTDESGYYSLTVSTERDYLGIAFSKKDYLDTVIVVRPSVEKLDVGLLPRGGITQKMPVRDVAPGDVQARDKPLEEMAMVRWLVPERQLSLSQNIVEFLERIPIQLSVVPSIGTNRLVSGGLQNNFSLNLFSGYSYGLRGVEVGGLLNIVREDVKGVQVSGFGNVVGGTVEGAQVSGFFNNTRGSVKGMQAAGFSNIVLDTITGIQVAGFSNVVHGQIKGAQISGFSNVATKDVDGLQISGFTNVAVKNVNYGQVTGFLNYGRDIGGAQIAGFANIANGDVAGAQIAGYLNVADSVKGVQIAGFANVATGCVTGTQIAAFINAAKKVDGIQIALFNFADSVGGVSIGLFSWVTKGYHEFELSHNEVYDGNLAFKTGTSRFYNIFSAGASVKDSVWHWAPGYGFGTEVSYGKSKRVVSNFDLTGHAPQVAGLHTDQLAVLGQFKIGLGIRFGKHLVINGGPTFNVDISGYTDPETGALVSLISNPPQWESNTDKLLIGYRIGYHASIRF